MASSLSPALVVAAGLAVLAVTRSAPAPERKPASPRPSRLRGARVLLVGDSLAQGLAPALHRLAAGDGVHLEARGVKSTTISDWARKPWLAEGLVSAAPSLVLASLGTNDARLEHPEAERGDLAAFVAQVDRAGAELVWIAPPSLPFDDRGVRAMLADAHRPTFPSDAITIARGGDRLHPTPAGYQAWASALWAWLT